MFFIVLDKLIKNKEKKWCEEKREREREGWKRKQTQFYAKSIGTGFQKKIRFRTYTYFFGLMLLKVNNSRPKVN